jgi:hypothetical protein
VLEASVISQVWDPANFCFHVTCIDGLLRAPAQFLGERLRARDRSLPGLGLGRCTCLCLGLLLDNLRDYLAQIILVTHKEIEADHQIAL